MTTGSRYFKTDLHTHTPASLDYGQKGTTAKEFVGAAIAAGLDIVAVTDHNAAGWCEAVHQAAKGTSLTVFPGVELSTPHGHVLAIFDVGTSQAKMDDFLSQVGIAIEQRGKKEAMSTDIETVLEKINAVGAIAIAAHANSTNGLLQVGAPGQFRIRVYHREELAGLEFTKQGDVEKFTQGKVSAYKAKACVQGSDAHQLTELGQRFTYLKMDGASLEGLKQALLDHEVRVRFAWNFCEVSCPHIKSLAVDQGFFGGAGFYFHSELNCFVGGQGTGKSTVIELLRYCFDDISPIEEIAQDTMGKIKALVGDGGTITVRYVDVDGDEKTVRREAQPWDTQPEVITQEGNASALLTAPVFFSQGELVRIAGSPIAQVDLIDRYLSITDHNSAEKQNCEALRVNASRLQELAGRQQELTETIEAADTGLKATDAKCRTLEKSLKDPILKEFPKLEAEKRFLADVSTGLTSIADALEGAINGIDANEYLPSTLGTDSPNYKALKPANEICETVSTELERVATLGKEKIRAKVKELAAVERSWTPVFTKAKEQHEVVLEKVGAESVRKAEAALRNLSHRLEGLKAQGKELSGIKEKMAQLQGQRKQFRDRLGKAREARFAKRKAKVTEWQKVFQNKIAIDVEPCGDTRQYAALLKALCKGAMLREQDVNSIARAIPPSGLVDIVERQQIDELADRSSIKHDNARKCIEVLRRKTLTELAELETVELPDTPVIKYEVEPGRFKAVNELSVGQKGTVILSIALVEGNAPLVIDHPEEPLDTLAIYDHIVRNLRGRRAARQYLFTTHNPNIAVGADAELNFVLDATADKGSIKAAGGVDNPETNRLLLYHLEGGPEAFALRSRKYRKQ